jgi:hypothetical protein
VWPSSRNGAGVKGGVSELAKATTMLMLDSVMKQAAEVRRDAAQCRLHPAVANRFEKRLNEIEKRTLMLFADLV